MGRKWVVGLVGVVAALGLAGFGFAAFTSTATITGTATSGSFALAWDSGATGIPNPDDSQACHTVGSGTTLTFTGTNFQPGDGCSVTDLLYDTGTVPGTVTESYSLTGTASCLASNWTYTDSISAAGATGLPIAPGSPVSDTITVTLLAAAGNGCEGATVGISATVTGTAT